MDCFERSFKVLQKIIAKRNFERKVRKRKKLELRRCGSGICRKDELNENVHNFDTIFMVFGVAEKFFQFNNQSSFQQQVVVSITEIRAHLFSTCYQIML